MAYLVVGGITVPVSASSAPKRSDEEIGDRSRAFDGTMRETLIAIKHNFNIETSPLSRTDADTLVAALRTTPPITCSGDWLGASGGYFATISDYHGVKIGTENLIVVVFTLLEA